jgi:hypothetical protein
MAKWRRFTKRSRIRNYFVYCSDYHYFRIGRVVEDEDTPYELSLGKFFSLEEILDQNLIIYWAPIPLKSYEELVRKDEWEKGQAAVPDAKSLDQTSLTEEELEELQTGKKWAKRTYNADYLEPQEHKKKKKR